MTPRTIEQIDKWQLSSGTINISILDSIIVRFAEWRWMLGSANITFLIFPFYFCNMFHIEDNKSKFLISFSQTVVQTQFLIIF